MKTKATQFMLVTEETKLVTITRRDISPGQQMAQSTHATADIVYQLAFNNPDLLHEWKRVSNSVINLSVKDIDELELIYNKFKDEVTTVKFFEPDIDEYTSIGFILHKEHRKKLSHLPLSLRHAVEVNPKFKKILEQMKDFQKDSETFLEIYNSLNESNFSEVIEIVNNMNFDDYDARNIMLYATLIQEFGDMEKLKDSINKLVNESLIRLNVSEEEKKKLSDEYLVR